MYPSPRDAFGTDLERAWYSQMPNKTFSPWPFWLKPLRPTVTTAAPLFFVPLRRHAASFCYGFLGFQSGFYDMRFFRFRGSYDAGPLEWRVLAKKAQRM